MADKDLKAMLGENNFTVKHKIPQLKLKAVLVAAFQLVVQFSGFQCSAYSVPDMAHWAAS